jgi:hypothetical protein
MTIELGVLQHVHCRRLLLAICPFLHVPFKMIHNVRGFSPESRGIVANLMEEILCPLLPDRLLEAYLQASNGFSFCSKRINGR